MLSNYFFKKRFDSKKIKPEHAKSKNTSKSTLIGLLLKKITNEAIIFFSITTQRTSASVLAHTHVLPKRTYVAYICNYRNKANETQKKKKQQSNK